MSRKAHTGCQPMISARVLWLNVTLQWDTWPHPYNVANISRVDGFTKTHVLPRQDLL